MQDAEPTEPTPTKIRPNCYVFDLDGTLADNAHRFPYIANEPKDWDSYFLACGLDQPIEHMIRLAQHLRAAGIDLIYVTGRSDVCAPATVKWMSEHGVPGGPIFMRKAGDHRPDHLIKIEMLAQLRRNGYEPIMVFDDRNAVVKAWRESGVPCAQVAEGDF